MVEFNKGAAAAKPAAKGTVSETEKKVANITKDKDIEVTEAQKDAFQSHSGDLTLFKVLTHPTRTEEIKRDNEVAKVHRAVGYAFTVNSDTFQYEDFGPITNTKNLDQDYEKNRTPKTAKKGDVIYLTPLELLGITSDITFGGVVTGGKEQGRALTVIPTEPKVKAGSDVPAGVHVGAQVRFTQGNSISMRSDENSLPVGISVASKDGKFRAEAYPEGEHPEFDKWRVLFKKRTSAGTGARTTDTLAENVRKFEKNSARQLFISQLKRSK